MFLDPNHLFGPSAPPVVSCADTVSVLRVYHDANYTTACALWRPTNTLGKAGRPCFWDAQAQQFAGEGCEQDPQTQCITTHLTGEKRHS